MHVKLDTGMGRLGTKDRELALRLAARPNVVGLMTHFATADDPGDDLFAAQLDGLPRVRGRGRARRADGSRGQQRRRAARPGQPLRHGPLRGRHLRDGPVRRGPRAPTGSSRRSRCAPGWVPCAASRRATRPATAGAGRAAEPTWVATVPIGYGDGWRRGADQQLRRADPRPPPSAGRDGQHGQRDGGARPRHRRRGRRRGGPDRRAGGGAHTGRGGGAPARTRSTTRSPARCCRGCAAGTCRDRAPGSSAARCATSCSAARCATSTWRWPATPRGPRAPSRPSVGGPVFRLSEAFGAWRVIDRRDRRVLRLLAAPGRLDRGRSAPARLHRQCDGAPVPGARAGGELIDPLGGRADLEAAHAARAGPGGLRARSAARPAPAALRRRARLRARPGDRAAHARRPPRG